MEAEAQLHKFFVSFKDFHGEHCADWVDVAADHAEAHDISAAFAAQRVVTWRDVRSEIDVPYGDSLAVAYLCDCGRTAT